MLKEESENGRALNFAINLVPRLIGIIGHMYTCPTKQKLSIKSADLKRSLDSVGQTEYPTVRSNLKRRKMLDVIAKITVGDY